ncbi:MAG: hypothetical protein AAF355_10595 [Myxococcota bacterium]
MPRKKEQDIGPLWENTLCDLIDKLKTINRPPSMPSATLRQYISLPFGGARVDANDLIDDWLLASIDAQLIDGLHRAHKQLTAFGKDLSICQEQKWNIDRRTNSLKSRCAESIQDLQEKIFSFVEEYDKCNEALYNGEGVAAPRIRKLVTKEYLAIASFKNVFSILRSLASAKKINSDELNQDEYSLRLLSGLLDNMDSFMSDVFDVCIDISLMLTDCARLVRTITNQKNQIDYLSNFDGIDASETRQLSADLVDQERSLARIQTSLNNLFGSQTAWRYILARSYSRCCPGSIDWLLIGTQRDVTFHFTALKSWDLRINQQIRDMRRVDLSFCNAHSAHAEQTISSLQDFSKYCQSYEGEIRRVENKLRYVENKLGYVDYVHKILLRHQNVLLEKGLKIDNVNALHPYANIVRNSISAHASRRKTPAVSAPSMPPVRPPAARITPAILAPPASSVPQRPTFTPPLQISTQKRTPAGLRKRRQREKSTATEEPPRQAIAAQPGTNALKVQWGFLVPPQPDLWKNYVRGHVSGARKERHENALRRGLEKPPKKAKPSSLPHAFGHLTLFHITICSGHLSIFFAIEGHIQVYAVTRHVRTTNREYQGLGSLPDWPNFRKVNIKL